MAQNYYAEINLHLTWHTKESAPYLTGPIESIVHRYLRGRCTETPGVYVHALGGIETHVHLAISIPPTLLISEFVGKLKGASSHDANQRSGHKVLEWQSGYGVVSFGSKDLPWVVDYVRNQKDRHARGRVEDRLERITELETEAKADEREAP